jgi:vancomycin resistance protein YoaR
VRTATLLCLTFVAALAAGAVVGMRRVLPRFPIAVGVSIDGHRVPTDTQDLGNWVNALRSHANDYQAHFRNGVTYFDSPFESAGITVDVDATLRSAKRVAHEGTFWQRLVAAERARRSGVDLPIVWAVDRARAKALLATFARDLAVLPVDAQLDLTAHKRVADQDGRILDIEASLEELVRARHEDQELVELITRRAPAKVRLEDLARVDIEHVLSAYETSFVTFGTGAARATNIRTAAGHLDGTILRPGDVFSFNDVVGPRTRERGFVMAPEIQADELKLGYGGGTCQLSSTLHVASLFGALEVVERQAHSRPSSYTQVGLDATVIFPRADLKIRNPFPYPVIVHAFLPRPTSVRVEILGGKPVAKVDYAYGVANPEDYDRRVEVKPTLKPGEFVLHQKGTRGFEATSVVTIHYFDGHTEERHYVSGYRPAPEIFWVAPGYDPAELPPLSEDADHPQGLLDSGASRGPRI